MNKLLDTLSDSLSQRKGLLIIISILLILLNFTLQLIPGAGWIAQTNLFLHFGIILGLTGVMIAWAL